MSEPTPNHRERLLDLTSQTVVPHPHHLELTEPATPATPASTEAETAEANRIAQEVASKE